MRTGPLSILLAFVCVACAPKTLGARDPIEIDSAWEPEQVEQIVAAMTEWGTATRGHIAWPVRLSETRSGGQVAWIARGHGTGESDGLGATFMSHDEAPWLSIGGEVRGAKLAYTVAHELGHAMGLQHSASGLMQAEVPDPMIMCIDGETLRQWRQVTAVTSDMVVSTCL